MKTLDAVKLGAAAKVQQPGQVLEKGTSNSQHSMPNIEARARRCGLFVAFGKAARQHTQSKTLARQSRGAYGLRHVLDCACAPALWEGGHIDDRAPAANYQADGRQFLKSS